MNVRLIFLDQIHPRAALDETRGSQERESSLHSSILGRNIRDGAMVHTGWIHIRKREGRRKMFWMFEIFMSFIAR